MRAAPEVGLRINELRSSPTANLRFSPRDARRLEAVVGMGMFDKTS